MRKILLIFILTSLVLSFTSCYGFAVIRKDGPYEGRVIDVDTGEPIEGVVVLGVWYKEIPTPGGTVSEYYDAQETVTDKNGEFKIDGLGLKILSNVAPMDVLIFKAGYTYYGLMTWKEIKGLYKTEGNKAIIRLKKLKMEERRKQGTPDFYVGKRYDEKENLTHTCIPKNIKLLPREVNKELLEQRRKP